MLEPAHTIVAARPAWAYTQPEALKEGKFSVYHALGWCAIPLKAREKLPALTSWKQYQLARPSPEQCAAWEHDHYNVGIVTGQVSGLFVLDIDGADGEATLRGLEERHSTLPRTAATKTGKGLHFYFRYPLQLDGEIRNLSKKAVDGTPLPGIDVRGNGGYVVAPPSIHPSGAEYVWHLSPWDTEVAEAPAWLLELVTVKPQAASLLNASLSNGAKRQDSYLQAALQGELTALAQVSNGSRNDQLNKSAFALGQLIAAGLNESEARGRLEAVALAIGLDRQEITRTIESGILAGMATPRTDTTDSTKHVSVLSVGSTPISDKNNWPDPTSIGFQLMPVEPLPLSIIPEPYRARVADISHRMQCPPDIAATAMMVMTAAVIGAGCGIRPKRQDDWLIIPNLYGAAIGRPGILLKTPTMAEALRPLSRLETDAKEAHDTAIKYHGAEEEMFKAKRDALKSDMSALAKKKSTGTVSAEALMAQYAELEEPEEPSLRRYRTNDSTVEKLIELLNKNPRGLLVFRDEIMGLIASWDREGREADRAFFLEAWNGKGSYFSDRIGRGTIHTKNICVSIYGSIQPDKLLHHLNSCRRENDGIFQRFQLLVYPDEPKGWQLVDEHPNIDATERVYAILKNLSEMDFTACGAEQDEPDGIPYYRFDEQAQTLFYTWLERLELDKLRGSGMDGMLVEHLSKYRKLMPALALTFHLIEVADGCAQGAITLSSAERAAAWCDYLESHARRVYGMIETLPIKAAQALLERIKKGELGQRFSLRDVYRRQWAMLTEREMVQAACDTLVASHWLKEETVIMPVNQRSRLEYVVTPKLHAGGEHA